jgi:hypothetical protein
MMTEPANITAKIIRNCLLTGILFPLAVSTPVLAEIASRTHRVIEERFAHAESCVLADAPLGSATYAKFPLAPDLSTGDHVAFAL